MSKKIIVAAVLLLTVCGALAGVKALQISAMVRAGKSFSIPPETVSSAVVREERWGASLPAVGSITAVQGVVLRAELSGTVSQIAFESGAIARKGQVLVQLDVSSEEAQLRSAEAQSELARQNVARSRELRAKDYVPQSDLDSAEAAVKESAAQADNIRALIAKKTIRAPFAGRLGIRSVNLGQYVNAGDPIVSLQSLDPVYADFTLPEQELGHIRTGMPVRVATDAAPGRTFAGALTAVNPDVDATTRNVRLQATLPNADGELRPGMFARVEVVLPQAAPVLVVPATAVLHAPYGDSVCVITEARDEKTGRTAKQVRMTTVRLGEMRGDFVAVTQGLEAGQTVASSGVFKLRNGAPVVIDNTLAPSPETNPKPADS